MPFQVALTSLRWATSCMSKLLAASLALTLAILRRAGFDAVDIGLLRNHYVGRTFIDPSQNVREQKVKLKFNPIAGVLKGKRVVLVDDSIVRGTTLKFLTKMLRDAGADKVHIRISSPPVMNPCYYGMDFPSKEELIAGTMTQEETRKLLGADTLEYLSIKGLLSVVPRGGGSYCAACFDGKYPEEIPAGSTKFRCE